MRLMEYVHKDKVTNRIQRFSETSDAEKWLFYNVLQYDYRPEKQIDMVMQHYNVEREDAEKVLYNFKRKSYELGNLGSETPVIENLTGDKMKTSSRKIQKEDLHQVDSKHMTPEGKKMKYSTIRDALKLEDATLMGGIGWYAFVESAYVNSELMPNLGGIMGRGISKEGAIQDFFRRAKDDGHQINEVTSHARKCTQKEDLHQVDSKHMTPGWYIVDRSGNAVYGPFPSEMIANQKRKEAGFSTEVEYFSDYEIRRHYNEGTSHARKCTQKEAVTLLNKLIKEQVMSYYTKESGKNIKKNEKLKEPTKERMATEQEKENKKQELVEALLELTHEYNTTPFMDVNEVIKKLTEVGKIISAKKATIEENMKNFKYGRKIYVHELVEMMLEKEEKPESAIETYDEEYAKKTAPEKAKEVTDEVREDGKEEAKSTEKTSDTLGKTEAAPSKPKGVKTMKEDKPLRFKSFMTGKK